MKRFWKRLDKVPPDNRVLGFVENGACAEKWSEESAGAAAVRVLCTVRCPRLADACLRCAFHARCSKLWWLVFRCVD